mmetsp:Transcript_10484/g.18449  ORF Transcript_10484/g.18449 Transcript_10484/m.18449 type:complete len:594 (-) Transcript_10484:223-2004(-)
MLYKSRIISTILPDRNINNAEEATKKMQEINHAFHEIEQILSSENGGEDDDDSSVGQEYESSDSESENYNARGRSKAAKRRAKNKKKKQRYHEEAEFDRKMEEEMAKFERAQRNAEKGSFAPTSTKFASTTTTPTHSYPKADGVPNQRGMQGKGKSKAAKRRAKKKADKNANNDISAKDDDSNHHPGTATSIPFHRLAPEKRCEIKFRSLSLIKSPLFTAIRARTYNMLQIFGLVTHVCDPIPLSDDVLVTPLMVASYLGDDRAADIIIQNSENRWAEAVLAKTRHGDDCLALATEARDIAEKLYMESKDHLDEATTEEDREKQEHIIEQHKESFEMATKLVERIESLKLFALEKKRKNNIRFSIKILAIGLACIMCFQFYEKVKPVLGVVWMALRFCIKMLLIGSIFTAFCFIESSRWLIASGLISYYYYTMEPASSLTSDPTPEPVPSPWRKLGDSIDIFCASGETCLAEGHTCSDGITEECCGKILDSFVCECGADLKYSCFYTNACLDLACETDEPPAGDVEVETPSDIPTEKMRDLIGIEPTTDGLLEAVGVGICLTLIIGGMLYTFWQPRHEVRGCTKKKKRQKKRN